VCSAVSAGSAGSCHVHYGTTSCAQTTYLLRAVLITYNRHDQHSGVTEIYPCLAVLRSAPLTIGVSAASV
jgi:hypothetical protein